MLLTLGSPLGLHALRYAFACQNFLLSPDFPKIMDLRFARRKTKIFGENRLAVQDRGFFELLVKVCDLFEALGDGV